MTTLSKSNAMPAFTWHRLDMNYTDVELDDALAATSQVVVEADGALAGAGAAAGCAGDPAASGNAASADAFDAAVAGLQAQVSADAAAAPADTRAILHAADGSEDPSNLEVPALSAYEQRALTEEMANDVAAAFECGMGQAAGNWFAGQLAAAGAAPIVLAAGKRQTGSATVRVNGVDGAANVACIDVVAAEGATVNLTVSLDSPAAGAGVAAVQVRVFAGEYSHVNVTSVHILDEGYTALDNTGIVAAEGAHVTVAHRMLGAGKSYTGLACDLRRDTARVDISTRYLAGNQDVRDFNYVVRHRGRKTMSNIEANGSLMGESKKTYRGTIDLVHGCKGSQGSENETVLLVDEKVDNKTIPVILCDEDDVAGNHGATIGHVAPDQMFYLKCRGLSQAAAEGLFATATLEETAIAIDDAQVRAGIARLAATAGIPYQEVED